MSPIRNARTEDAPKQNARKRRRTGSRAGKGASWPIGQGADGIKALIVAARQRHAAGSRTPAYAIAPDSDALDNAAYAIAPDGAALTKRPVARPAFTAHRSPGSD